MNVENALSLWSAACSAAGIRWYLFRETLLCAVGYQHFPDTLTCPQVAVFGSDLPDLIQNVFPSLPSDWILDKTNFGREKRNLIFYRKDRPVLQLCVLCGVEGEAQAEAFDAQVNRILHKVNRLNLLKKILFLIPLFSRIFGNLFRRILSSMMDAAFGHLIALAGATVSATGFYWDHLTNKSPTLLPGALFEESTTLPCSGVEYPVFSGFQAYLTTVFGDYENGLADEIGCGLTIEEKESLKAHQARCFEALRFLQEVSREFNLRYYLLAGSVLGCVRHGGFIPWDDDIDVGIRIEELEQFEKIVKEQLPLRLPQGFTLMQSGADNPYPRMFSKICYEGRCCIDLWPLVPTYNHGFRAELTWYFAKLITKVHYKKIGHRVTRFLKLVNVLDLFLTDKMVMALARHNERKYAHRRTPAYINLYSIYRRPKETIQRAWLDEEATALFQGLEVPVVGCTEEYLTHLYGDYMAQPAPWNRASRHYERFYPENSGT